ncbi:unnamed protein product, partial [Trichogramma brassicae]
VSKVILKLSWSISYFEFIRIFTSSMDKKTFQRARYSSERILMCTIILLTSCSSVYLESLFSAVSTISDYKSTIETIDDFKNDEKLTIFVQTPLVNQLGTFTGRTVIPYNDYDACVDRIVRDNRVICVGGTFFSGKMKNFGKVDLTIRKLRIVTVADHWKLQTNFIKGTEIHVMSHKTEVSDTQKFISAVNPNILVNIILSFIMFVVVSKVILKLSWSISYFEFIRIFTSSMDKNMFQRARYSSERILMCTIILLTSCCSVYLVTLFSAVNTISDYKSTIETLDDFKNDEKLTIFVQTPLVNQLGTFTGRTVIPYNDYNACVDRIRRDDRVICIGGTGIFVYLWSNYRSTIHRGLYEEMIDLSHYKVSFGAEVVNKSKYMNRSSKIELSEIKENYPGLAEIAMKHIRASYEVKLYRMSPPLDANGIPQGAFFDLVEGKIDVITRVVTVADHWKMQSDFIRGSDIHVMSRKIEVSNTQKFISAVDPNILVTIFLSFIMFVLVSKLILKLSWTISYFEFVRTFTSSMDKRTFERARYLSERILMCTIILLTSCSSVYIEISKLILKLSWSLSYFEFIRTFTSAMDDRTFDRARYASERILMCTIILLTSCASVYLGGLLSAVSTVNDFKSTIETFDDFKNDKKLTIYVHTPLVNLINTFTGRTGIAYEDFHDCIDKILHKDHVICIGGTIFIGTNGGHESKLVHISKPLLSTNTLVFPTRPNWPLRTKFNRIFSRLYETGITENGTQKFISAVDPNILVNIVLSFMMFLLVSKVILKLSWSISYFEFVRTFTSSMDKRTFERARYASERILMCTIILLTSYSSVYLAGLLSAVNTVNDYKSIIETIDDIKNNNKLTIYVHTPLVNLIKTITGRTVIAYDDFHGCIDKILYQEQQFNLSRCNEVKSSVLSSLLLHTAMTSKISAIAGALNACQDRGSALAETNVEWLGSTNFLRTFCILPAGERRLSRCADRLPRDDAVYQDIRAVLFLSHRYCTLYTRTRGAARIIHTVHEQRVAIRV